MALDRSASQTSDERYHKVLESLIAGLERRTNDRNDRIEEKIGAISSNLASLVQQQVQTQILPIQRTVDDLGEAVGLTQSELAEIQGQPAFGKDGRVLAANGFYYLDSIIAVTDKAGATPTSIRKSVKHFVNSRSDDWVGFTYARGFQLKSGKTAVQLGISPCVRDLILSMSFELLKDTGIALRDNLTTNGITERNNLNKRFDILKDEGYVPCWRQGAVLFVRERNKDDGSLSRAYPAADIKGYGSSSSSDGGEGATGNGRTKPGAPWQEQKGRNRHHRQQSGGRGGHGRGDGHGGRAGGPSDHAGGRGYKSSGGHGGDKSGGGSRSSDGGANGNKSPSRLSLGKRDNDVPNTALKHGLGIRDHKKPDLGATSQGQRATGDPRSGSGSAGEGTGGRAMDVDSGRGQQGAWRRPSGEGAGTTESAQR